MFPCAIKTYKQTLLLLFVFTYVNGQERQIVSKLNPGCESCDSTRRPLIYIRAEGSNDTIHQLWDFTDCVPTVVFAVGRPNSTLNIQWNGAYPDKFEFSDSPLTSYSFAAAIDSIIEYNDVKDIGHFDPKGTHRNRSLDHLSWQLIDSILTDKEAMVIVHGEESGRRGVFEMKLDLLPFSDYATDLPHLIHTANSSLIDVRLVNQTGHRTYNSSRFALHFVLVSTDPPTASWDVTMRKSLDDEHTPGVFEIFEVESPKSAGSGQGGFIQFRPVAYTDPQREVSSSTNAYISHFNRTEFPRHGIIRPFYRGYFGLQPQRDVIVQDMVISFGLAGDGFYKQHNFTAWSFTVGYGSPPLEGFSLFVVIIISIGLAVPTLLALSGVVYVLVRRCKQTNPPTRFTNDD